MTLGLFLGYKVGLGKCILYRTAFLSCIHIFPFICLLEKNYFVPLLTLRKLSTPCGDLGFGKLIKNKISGKMFRVILNLYTDIKSCVKNGDLHSHLFTCETGVRQAKSYLLSICLVSKRFRRILE